MKHILIATFGIILVLSSCAGLNKKLKSRKTAAEPVASVVEDIKETAPEAQIREVEEKLVPINQEEPNPSRYFVIIGSFRNPDNAKRHQAQILKDGFKSEVVRNEEGLYRVSVLATNEVNIARDDIRRIRKIFPEYSDVWLLIQKR